jgi:uncharacterized iron-regulated membrane protein
MRRVIFWAHLICGVSAGLVILMMSFTGVLLTYERQMIAWADRGYRSSPISGVQPMSMEALLAAQPQAPATVTVRSEADAPVELSYGPERIVYVDAYTGERLGEGAQGIRKFFSSVTQWHRWFGAAVERRATARAITGACNLAFLVLLITGAFLWFPPMIGRFRGGLSGKARDFNWHNVIGVWSVVPLIVIVASGVVMSYPWASNLVYKLTWSPVPGPIAGPGGGGRGSVGPGGPGGGRGGRGGGGGEVQVNGMDAALARVRAEVPAWQTVSTRLAGRGPMVVTVDESHRGRPDLRTTLTIDRRSADVLRRETFADSTLGARARRYLRFAHTGELGGWIGQTIAGLVSAGAVVLVWTGITLALRRFSGWRSRRSRLAPATKEAAETVQAR